MTTKLLTERELWRSITSSVRRQPGRCDIAVAYFSSGAQRLLPLKKGSTLVVDMSRSAVSAGMTDPSAVLALLRQGVDVHSVGNLHAKVFVLGNRAIVGSSNASAHSKNQLIEAAIETGHKKAVSECRRFVEGLRGELVSPEYAKKMRRFYRPPKTGKPRGKNGPPAPVGPRHSPVWVVPLERESWDERDDEAYSKGLPKAKSKLRSTRRYEVDEFQWAGLDLLARLREGDQLIQVTDEGRRRHMVHAACRVLEIQRYKKYRANHAIVFLEAAKGARRKGVHVITKRLGSRAKQLAKLDGPKRLRDLDFVNELLSLWY